MNIKTKRLIKNVYVQQTTYDSQRIIGVTITKEYDETDFNIWIWKYGFHLIIRRDKNVI